MLTFTKRKEMIDIFQQFRKDALNMYGIEPDDSLETFLAFLTMGKILDEEKAIKLITDERTVHYNIIKEEYEYNAD